MADTPGSSSRPARSDRRSLPSPGRHPVLTLVTQPTQDTLEEDGHSKETVKSFPICPELVADATTPVFAGPQGSLPTAPPDSPSIKPPVLPSLNIPTVREDQGDLVRHKKAGSVRISKKRAPKKNVGVVVADFNGLYPDELSIKVGEEIEIISKDTIVSRNIGWWTGRKGKGKFGIFPAACVSCDMHQQGAGTTNSDYPLEIKNSEIDMKEVIGIGGFGKVYRAIYKGEDVAVKVAKTTTFDSLKAVQDVVSEAEKFAHLAHTNICALVGVVLVKDVCLVMEYAEGGALSDILHKSNISLSIEVITSWTSQIASGMHYLHHEAEPSLIHRDLKTSNILLANPVDPDNLKDNVIKITDFGLAREIEHTTHMSGAGTYPWMAPEVIRTSDFSKKSDVWSFAVVVWELLTGERPYNGLNLFVVAYGVGHGTLTLPVPDGCPEPLARLMNDCWKREHTERPSFEEIVSDVRNLEGSGFCTSMTHEEFGTMQTTWRGEIQKKFVELKKMEHELDKREKLLGKKVKELAEEKLRIDRRAEEVKRLLEQVKLAQEQPKRDSSSTDGPSGRPERPPRISYFREKKYFRKLRELWGSAKAGGRPKVDNPLPNKMDNVRAFRRITSSPAPSGGKSMEDQLSGGPSTPQWVKGHKRRSSDEVTGATTLCIGNTLDAYRRGSVPNSPNSQHRAGGGVNPSSYQPVIAQHPRKRLTTTSSLRRKETSSEMRGRPRSHSDLRSTSPQQQQQQQLLLPSLPPSKAGSSPPNLTPATKPAFLGLLTSGKFTSAPEANSPGSPSVTVTTVDHPLSQYDSGKDSMTCSDASGHSNYSETSTTQPDMIKFDSPSNFLPNYSNASIDFIAQEFDPLRPSISHDSLLCMSATSSAYQPHPHLSSSPTPTPQLSPPMQQPLQQFHQHQQQSTRGKRNSLEGTPGEVAWNIGGSPGPHQWTRSSSNASESTSPKQSLTTSLTTPTSITATSPIPPARHDSSSSMHPSPSIARKRPKPSKEYSLNTISAPSSRPPSPRGDRSLPVASGGIYRPSKGTVSPTGSVQSLIYDWDSYGDAFTLDSASDVTSTSSSLLDLSAAGELDNEEEEEPTMREVREINILLGFLNSKYN